jgi:acetyl-CoA carboxylase beta subunit
VKKNVVVISRNRIVKCTNCNVVICTICLNKNDGICPNCKKEM